VAANAERATAHRLERDWWLRAFAVFASPRAVFAALRDDSDAAASARAEPVLALTLLAGIAGVLATPTVGNLLDDPLRDGLVVAVILFLAGGLYGLATYWVGGGALAVGIRSAGGVGSYRQARHVLAFAVAPVALALFLVWPLRLAAYGGDVFRDGGADERGAARWLFEAGEVAFFGWAAVLLVLGVKTVHDWPLVRAVGALALGGLALVCLALVFALL
jgi:hypothetical protein